MAHILGQCTHTKAKRIRRHNDICDFVQQRIAVTNPQARIIKEELFATRRGNLKPDLVVIDKERVHVLDVTVR
jgi:hypothetical protein